MKKKHIISKEVKDQILHRIKHDGISAAQAARDAGINENTVYNWLSRGVKGQPTILEMGKLKRENKELKELLAEATIALSRAQKKNF